MTVAKRVLGLAKSYGRRGLATLSAQIVENLAGATDAGELWLDRRTTARILASLLGKQKSVMHYGNFLPLLTDRERSIVAATVKHKGASTKVIANSMDISSHTLRNHLASIYKKLGVHRRLDLLLYAMEVGLDQQTGLPGETATDRLSVASRLGPVGHAGVEDHAATCLLSRHLRSAR